MSITPIIYNNNNKSKNVNPKICVLNKKHFEMFRKHLCDFAFEMWVSTSPCLYLHFPNR